MTGDATGGGEGPEVRPGARPGLLDTEAMHATARLLDERLPKI